MSKFSINILNRQRIIKTTSIILNKSSSTSTSSILNEYLSKILTAQVYEVATETPIQYAAGLSSLINNTVYLKREDTQPVFSCKPPITYNL
jgi:tryptophan synthase beta subunit